MKFFTSFFAISYVLPFTSSVIIEVEAIDIAHPLPSNDKSSTFGLHSRVCFLIDPHHK